MSARRIRVIGARNQNPLYVQTVRQDVVTRKKEERQIRDQHKRERKIESYLADDENFPSFSTQLGKLRLQLRDIPGDGNCLFRALGDQLEGHCRNHFKYRFQVANYMSEHRDEFEPFVEDDMPFERYIKNLSTIGTYAGNDAIVAFARLYQINVVIHQLNSPFLLIQGPKTASPTTKQIHISYHNGDHYSSVRKLGDNTESPANIKVKIGGDSQSKLVTETNGEASSGVPHCGRVVKAVRNMEIIEQEIMAATGCNDLTLIHEALYECDNDVDSTIAHILQIMSFSDDYVNGETASVTSQRTSTDSGVCTGNNSPVSTHVRDNSYGGSSGYESLSNGSGVGAKPKKQQKEAQLTAKQRKEAKKLEKKKRAEERHKMKINGGMKTQLSDDEDVHTVVTKDIAMMTI